MNKPSVAFPDVSLHLSGQVHVLAFELCIHEHIPIRQRPNLLYPYRDSIPMFDEIWWLHE